MKTGGLKRAEEKKKKRQGGNLNHITQGAKKKIKLYSSIDSIAAHT